MGEVKRTSSSQKDRHHQPVKLIDNLHIHRRAAPLDLFDDIERGVGDELVHVALFFAELILLSTNHPPVCICGGGEVGTIGYLPALYRPHLA